MLFSLKNTVFTVFSGIIQNPIVSVWYYHMPFFSNVETQVPGLINKKIVNIISTFIFKLNLTYLYIEGKLVTGVQLNVRTAAGVLFFVTAAAALEAQAVHETGLQGRLHSPGRLLLYPVRQGALVFQAGTGENVSLS